MSAKHPARTSIALALGLALALGGPPPAAAQPAKGRAGAPLTPGKAEFEAGLARFSKKDWAGALPHFRAALTVSGSPNAALYVGRCLTELGQLVEAYDTMVLAERESEKRMAQEPAYRKTNETAKDEVAQLDKKVARVRVTVADAPTSTVVSVNGVQLSNDRLKGPVAVPTGKVVVVAFAAGRPEQRVEVDAPTGQETAVSLRFPGERPEPPPAVAPAPTPLAPTAVRTPAPTPQPVSPAPERRGMTNLRIAGIAVAGVGVIGLGVFTVAGIASNAKYDDILKQCGGRCTDPKFNAEIDGGQTLDTVANVGLILGVLGVGGGAAMFVLGGRRPQASAQVRVTPTSARLEGSF